MKTIKIILTVATWAWPFFVFVYLLNGPINDAVEGDIFNALVVAASIWAVGYFLLFVIKLLVLPRQFGGE